MIGSKKRHRAPKADTDTLVGKNTEVFGDIRFSGSVRLHIDGTVRGSVLADDHNGALLTVSKTGIIEGEVRVPNIILDGGVLGDVYASEHVELAANAKVTGNVYYNLIEMAMGAEVNGNLVRSQGDTAPPPVLAHSDSELSPEE